MIGKDLIKRKLSESLMEYDNKRIVAGVLIKCAKTDEILLLLRNDKIPTWALVSGNIEKGENPLEALKREIYEELFINPNKIEFKFMRIEHIPDKNIDFYYYEGLTNSKFTPILDHENLNFGWFNKENLPTPLFKGLAEKIAKI